MFGSLKNDMTSTTCNMDSETKRSGHLKCEERASSSKKQNGQAQCRLSVGHLNGFQGSLAPTINGKKRQQKEMTSQDIYREEYDDDDDEDEDNDWDPSQCDSKRWFCTNCTMVNIDDVLHCDICGEYKDSKILTHGFYASNIAQEVDDAELRTEEKDSQTAVGFDERMLLHSENNIRRQYCHPSRCARNDPYPKASSRLVSHVRDLAEELKNSGRFGGIFPGRCIPIGAREITKQELELVDTSGHIEDIESTSSMLSSYFTPDTYANEHSACAARLAAGLCADLSSAILDGRAKNGFALVRPPGHHAGVKEVMGFCLHNNAAVAALAAQRANAKKVLIVDWDVHHGNGTQEIFDANKSVLYISLHRHEGGRFYPGTGAATQVGSMGAEGYCVNIPWKCGGVGDNDYIFAFQHVVLPIASEFAPDLTIISAGFDAARGDPLGCCDVTPAGYARMTQLLTTLSRGKLLVILEGGYNLRSISSSATSVIKVLLGDNPGKEMDRIAPTKAGLQTVMEVLQIQMEYWPKLESNLTKLLSEFPSFSFQSQEKHVKRKRRVLTPIWLKWGRKRLLYNLLKGKQGLKAKGRWPDFFKSC
ncbi:histone deacetylase [Ranunculus cassubicifolius]